MEEKKLGKTRLVGGVEREAPTYGRVRNIQRPQLPIELGLERKHTHVEFLLKKNPATFLDTRCFERKN